MNKVIPLLRYVTAITASQGICWALLWVARASKGLAAGQTLPAVVTVMVGWLFVALSLQAARALTPRQLALGAVAAALLNALLATFAPTPLLFFLAPLTALLSGLAYRAFGRHAAMLAAMSVYIVCTLLANFTFDSFVALPLYGQLSVGTLFFAITFTQRDRVHRFGKQRVYQMIAAAALTNALLGSYLGVAWRFLLAGFLAIILAETADTEVYQRVIKRRWLTRVMTSNAVSIPIDSVTFTLIAFAGVYGAGQLSEIVVADVVAKLVIGALAALQLTRANAQTPRIVGARAT